MIRRPVTRAGIPPRAGATQRIAVSIAGGDATLSIRGPGHVRVKAVGTQVQLLFGTAAGSVTLDQAGSGSDVGGSLLAGQSETYELKHETHVSWDAAGNGYLVISRADNGRVGR